MFMSRKVNQLLLPGSAYNGLPRTSTENNNTTPVKARSSKSHGQRTNKSANPQNINSPMSSLTSTSQGGNQPAALESSDESKIKGSNVKTPCTEIEETFLSFLKSQYDSQLALEVANNMTNKEIEYIRKITEFQYNEETDEEDGSQSEFEQQDLESIALNRLIDHQEIAACRDIDEDKKNAMLNAVIVVLQLKNLATREDPTPSKQEEKLLLNPFVDTLLKLIPPPEDRVSEKYMTPEQASAIESKIKEIREVENERQAEEAEKQRNIERAAKQQAEIREAEKAANVTALGVSTIIAIVSSIYSQAIQHMLFKEILFGKALLFGYTLPMVSLTAANIVFGLAVFSITLAFIFVAKLADKKPLFKQLTSYLGSKPSYKTILPTTAIAIVFVLSITYAIPLQMALFGKVLLGGTVLANLGFAFIATAFISMVSIFAATNNSNFKRASFLLTMVTGTWFANPILQALAGITITGTPGVIVTSSILVGLTAAISIMALILLSESDTGNRYGFILTMYALSFIVLSIYASPIQIAIAGQAIMFVTPLLSNISFGAVVGIFTSYITTTLYRKAEHISPILMNPAKMSADLEAGVKSVGTFAGKIVSEVKDAANLFGSDTKNTSAKL